MAELNRRNFLKAIGGASGLLLLNGGDALALTTPSFRNQLKLPTDRGMFGLLETSTSIDLTASQAEYEILPRTSTQLLVYEAEVGGKQYINPILKIKKGNPFNSILVNQFTGINHHSLARITR